MINQSKEELRKQISEKRKTLSDEFIAINSKEIARKLFSMDEYKDAETIYIYMDFKSEVSTKEIIEDALLKGKRVAIPKVVNDEIEFYYINSINDVSIGNFGIREPISSNLAQNELPLIIIPGVAFDKNRHRIGYGRGFYDKYLAKNKVVAKIALAFEFQLMEEIPFDDYDEILDIIITEKSIVQ